LRAARAAFALALGLVLAPAAAWSAAGLVGAAVVLAPATASAQGRGGGDELSAARRLFKDALKDDENKQFDAALEKFQRVQQVKDTAAVRYRIGTCFEGLGKWRQARAAYQGSIELAGADPKEADIAKSSRDHVADLERRMPQLTLTLGEKAPAGSEVTIDKETVPDSSLKQPIAVDPGQHEVSATGPGATPFRTTITMNEGARLSLTIPLDASGQGGGGALAGGQGSGNGAQGSGNGVSGGGGDQGAGGTGGGGDGEGAGGDHGAGGASGGGKRGAGSSGLTRKEIGFVATGVGVVLVATTAVLLVVRHGQISDLKTACPGGVCPLAKQQDLTSERSHAVTEGTVAAITGIAGVAALGAGVFLIATSPSSSSSSPSAAKKASARLSGYPLPGGGGALMMTGGF
jgi:hypothetical protein